VDDGCTGLLYDPTSAAELEAALRSLIEHPQLLSELAARVRSQPRIKSIEDDAYEWEVAYADVLGRRAAVGGVT